MPLPKVLVLILAGGAGNRLELLTATRAKPAVPFAGRFRLIDFPLSNCQHAQIADVWISVQYNPASLTRHLSNGRPWDLDRTTGGMLTLPPRQGSDRGGWHAGTADSLWRNAELIRDRGAELLVVLSADAVYKLDYREVVEAHLQGDQQLTMVTTQVAAEDAGRYGVVQVGDDDRITDYAYKPEEPATSTVATEVFVMTADPVLERLEALAQDAGDNGLDDLGDQLLPDLVDDGGAVVRRAILADGVVVGPDARVGDGSEGEVALVGRAVELSAGTVVPPGGRLPEED
jgi:glucose-1-phosphate adenylyltransferase